METLYGVDTFKFQLIQQWCCICSVPTASERKYPGLNWTCPGQEMPWEMPCCSIFVLSVLEYTVLSLHINSYIQGYVLVAIGTLITLASKQRSIASLDAVTCARSPVKYNYNFKVWMFLKSINGFRKFLIFISGLWMVVSTHFFRSIFFLCFKCR